MRLYPKRRRVHPRSDRAEEQAEKESSGGPSGHHRESIDSQHDAVRRTLSHPRIVTRGGRVSISSGATEDEFGVASPVGFNATVRTSTMTQHGTELVAKDSGMSLDGGGIDYSLPPLQCGDGKDTSSDDFFVDFRCGASRVTEVSTSAQTAYMKAYLALYWTDLRVADWEVRVATRNAYTTPIARMVVPWKMCAIKRAVYLAALTENGSLYSVLRMMRALNRIEAFAMSRFTYFVAARIVLCALAVTSRCLTDAC
eukprot:m.1550536 g.1550536  ORF g.1550536 m.1550536 type:complete len:255 (+) comp25265_c0_seq70:200-964(+)